MSFDWTTSNFPRPESDLRLNTCVSSDDRFFELKTFKKADERLIWLASLLCFGLFGSVEMLLFLGQIKMLHFVNEVSWRIRNLHGDLSSFF